jgi:hypothetical protein
MIAIDQPLRLSHEMTLYDFFLLGALVNTGLTEGLVLVEIHSSVRIHVRS